MKIDLGFSGCTHLNHWLKSPVIDSFGFVSANPYIMNYMISKNYDVGKYYILNPDKKIITKNITSKDHIVTLKLGLSLYEVYKCIPQILHKKQNLFKQKINIFNNTSGVIVCHPGLYNQYKIYENKSICALIHPHLPVNTAYFVEGGFIIPYNKVMRIAGFGVLKEKIHHIE